MKATKAQLQARVEEVLAIRLDGAEFWHVREYAREKEQEEGSAWKLAEGQKPLSDGQLWRYIGQADKMMAESCRASRKRLLRRHLAQRRNLYAKAVSQGDVRSALACIADEARLLGLYDLPAGPASLPSATTAPEVIRLLSAAIDQVGQGKLDARTAGTVGNLANSLLSAISATDLAARVEMLEAVLKLRDKDQGRKK